MSCQPGLGVSPHHVAPAAALASTDGASACLFGAIQQLGLDARRTVAVAVKAGLCLMYWRIGQRIRTEALDGQRVANGGQIVATPSRQLSWAHTRRKPREHQPQREK